MLSLLEMTFPNIDPVLLPIWGGIGLRWYGLGYLFSFLITLGALRLLHKGGYLRLAKDDCLSFIVWAIVGTLAGGRLGYLLFYTDYFWSGEVFSDPLMIIGVSGGKFAGGLSGLSFHGGLLGVIISGSIFGRIRMRRQWNALDEVTRQKEGKTGYWQRYRAMWCGIFDASVHGVPLGIAAVRMGNFINGELYGRLVHYDLDAVSGNDEMAQHLATRIINDGELSMALGQSLLDKPELLKLLGHEGSTQYLDDARKIAMQIQINPEFVPKLGDPDVLSKLFDKAPAFGDALSKVGVTAAEYAPSWAMRFPTTPEAQRAMDPLIFAQRSPDGLIPTEWGQAHINANMPDELPPEITDAELVQMKSRILMDAVNVPVDPELWSKVESTLPFRHPSQIYQALGEGLAVFLLVWIFRWFFPKRGMLGGLFLLSYAIMRIPAELFRQPDAQFGEGKEMGMWGSILDAISLTQGQLLSLVMAAAGIAMMFMSWRSKNPHMQLSRDVIRFKGIPMSDEEAGLPEVVTKKDKQAADQAHASAASAKDQKKEK